MHVFLWVVAIVLAAAFGAAGAMKLLQPKEKLIASGLGWAELFQPGVIKLIGAVELLAAIGLVLPGLTGVAPVLVPLAAVGLVLVMIGAIVTHVRRSELPMVAINLVLLVLALIVAWGRFGSYAWS